MENAKKDGKMDSFLKVECNGAWREVDVSFNNNQIMFEVPYIGHNSGIRHYNYSLPQLQNLLDNGSLKLFVSDVRGLSDSLVKRLESHYNGSVLSVRGDDNGDATLNLMSTQPFSIVAQSEDEPSEFKQEAPIYQPVTQQSKTRDVYMYSPVQEGDRVVNWEIRKGVLAVRCDSEIDSKQAYQAIKVGDIYSHLSDLTPFYQNVSVSRNAEPIYNNTEWPRQPQLTRNSSLYDLLQHEVAVRKRRATEDSFSSEQTVGTDDTPFTCVKGCDINGDELPEARIWNQLTEGCKILCRRGELKITLDDYSMRITGLSTWV